MKNAYAVAERRLQRSSKEGRVSAQLRAMTNERGERPIDFVQGKEVTGIEVVITRRSGRR